MSIILSPSRINANYTGLMRLFELYAIITPTHVHCCMSSDWYVLFVHLVPPGKPVRG